MGKTVARGHRERNLVDALNAEWDQLLSAHQGAVVKWSHRHEVLTGCDGLAHLLRRVRADPDPVLGALLDECQQGDQLAGRVVLQAMLGKVVRMATRDASAGVDDYVAEMWLRIRTYPLASRPTKVPANLALDTLKRVTAAGRAVRRGEVMPFPPEAFVQSWLWSAQDREDPGRVTDLSARRVITAARELGLLDGEAARVLALVYDRGFSGRAAAARLGTSPGMVRFRCSTTIARLARHATDLAAAA